MKSIRNLFFSGALLLGAIGTVTVTSCNKDECESVVCSNGGTCVDGDCQCPTGYEGTVCETESRTKFIRSYNATDNPPVGSPSTYTVGISSRSGAVTNVLINENFADDFFVNDINATVGGNTITIPSQEPDNDDFTVTGTGTFTAGTPNRINWSYTLAGPGSPTVTYTGIWTAQ